MRTAQQETKNETVNAVQLKTEVEEIKENRCMIEEKVSEIRERVDRVEETFVNIIRTMKIDIQNTRSV